MRWLCVCILLWTATLHAQVQEAATPFSGMAHTDVALSSPWSVLSNPAGTSQVSSFYAGVSYHCLFDLKELSTKTAFVLCPSSWGNWGLAYSHFGYEYYNEQLLRLSYGKRLGAFIDAGIKLDYLFSQAAKRSGIPRRFFFEAGVLVSLSPALKLGLFTSNPGDIAGMSASGSLQVDEQYSISGAWTVDEVFLLALQWELINRQNVYSAGVRFSGWDLIQASCGFRTNPERFYAGIGLQYWKFDLQFAYNTNSRLGNEVNVSLGVKF